MALVGVTSACFSARQMMRITVHTQISWNNFSKVHMVSAFIFSSTWPTFDLDIALYINYIKHLCLYILFSFTFYNMYTASLRFWSIVMFQFLIRCSEAIFLMSIIHRTRFDNSIVLSDIFHFSQIKYTTDRRSRDIFGLSVILSQCPPL